MARRYFGTDGVRGRVGVPPITPDFVLKLGQAAGRVFNREALGGRAKVLIGKDTRISGYLLEAALEAGLSSSGCDIVLCGPIPTPAVAYLTRALRLDAGIVISASHNPFEDNGIKFFSAGGRKLPDGIEEAIEAELDRGFECVASEHLGKAVRLKDAAGRYIEFCKSTVSSSVDLKGMRVLVDCANGAAYGVAPKVFHELGAEVVEVGTSPDGLNINRGVGATHTEHLSEWVRENGCDVGVSLDGDADRLIMADAEGRVYNGDELLYVMVKDRLAGGSPVEGVVGTLMTNFGLEKRFRDMGVGFMRAKVGDRYVLEGLIEKGWIFGGEGSGHLIVLDKQSTGDGIVSALQVLSAMRRSGRTLAELTADLEMMPQSLVNVRLAPGCDWLEAKAFEREVEAVRAELGDAGRVLIRPSGTEPLLRIMVECADADRASALAERLAGVLRSELV